jgi:cytochrome c5
MWSQSCALCHVDGKGGAPHVGNVDEWLPRLAQGEEVLLTHTLEGLNNMPPLGYCMACERDDFLAMINFMTAGISTASNEGTP